MGKLFPYCAYDQNMNVAKCKEYAIAYGYIVFALQAGTMCFVGNDLLHVTRLGYSNVYGCTYSCPGVGRDYCGGYLSNSIYMLNVPPPPMPPMPPNPPNPPPRPVYFNPPPSPVYLRPSPRPPSPAIPAASPRYPFSPWNPDVPFNPPKLPPPPRASAAASPESQMGTSVIVIIITVTIVIFVAILLLLICCFCRHRHRNATTPIYDYESQRQSQSQRQHYVEPSAPPMHMHAPDVLPPVKVPAAAAAAAIARRVEPIKDIPDMFTCPITQDVMHDPVIASDGHTYEKSAIEKWIKNGRNVSPMTNTPMASSVLTPNRNLKSAISTYMGS